MTDDCTYINHPIMDRPSMIAWSRNIDEDPDPTYHAVPGFQCTGTPLCQTKLSPMQSFTPVLEEGKRKCTECLSVLAALEIFRLRL